MNKHAVSGSTEMTTELVKRTAIDVGRALLQDWDNAQPDNYFSADVNLQRTLAFHWGEDRYAKHARLLYRFGGIAATVIDELVRESNLAANLPRLEPFDRFGTATDEVVYHPSYHEAGRHIYGSEMLSVLGNRGNNLLALALFYISSQNGEAGHNCPVACTAGMIKAIQALATDPVQNRYLPNLLNSNYDTLYHGAQFLTEIQGGSDVGANATSARLIDSLSGIWAITGEKWFCSNVSAHLALVTARVPEQGAGTRGLGLFLVPRVLEDGTPNRMRILRLKDKLGTTSMATAEISFENALAHQIGDTQQGFKNIMTYVINTSRIYNAVGVCGNARRAFLTALSYANYRTAFGQPIIHFPIVQYQLTAMRADAVAILSGTFHIVKLMDDIELGGSSEESEGFLRMALNLNKYRSSVIAHGVIVQAIEMLGGNGAIETFSVLPRLLRDNVVFENWEGTHNVLLDQVQRDIRRYGFHVAFLNGVRLLLESLVGEGMRDESLEQLEQIRQELDEILAMDPLTAAIYFRPLMDRLIDLYYAACMMAEGAWELGEKNDRTKLRLAKFYFDTRVVGRGPKDIPYFDDLVSRLAR